MKKIVLTSLAMFILIASHAQYSGKSNTTNLDLRDAPGYRQKNVGIGLTIGGGLLFTIGAILASQADSYYYSSNTTNGNTTSSGDPKGGFGVVMIAGGLGMAIPGIILWNKGAKKYNTYKQQQNLSLGIKDNGLSFRLRL